MALLRNIACGLKVLFRKEQSYREVNEELQHYFNASVERKMLDGMSRAQAQRAARIEMGSLESAKEKIHAIGWESVVGAFGRDLRHSLRSLVRTPVFTFTVVLTLALGIGANTAVFSILRTLVLKMLPVRDPQRLYYVSLENGGTQPPNTSGTGNGNTSFSLPVFQELRKQKQIFEELIAHVSLSYGKVAVRVGEEPEEAAGEQVSGNFFTGLGVPMAEGIPFSSRDEEQHSQVIVLSYSFWTRSFARNPNVVGKTIFIKGFPFVVVGVSGRFFLGVEPGKAMDFWIPLQMRPELNAWGEDASRYTLYGSPKWWALPMMARLAPGVTPEQAIAAAQSTFYQAASIGAGRLDPKKWPAHLGFELARGMQNDGQGYRQLLEILMALVGLILLIACINVAQLITARNAVCEREFGLRLAMGARTSHIFCQLFVESMLLVATGACAGWGLAVGMAALLARSGKIDGGFSLDGQVLAFTVGVSALAALFFGFMPLRHIMNIPFLRLLRGAGTAGSDWQKRWSGKLWMALQVAFCLTLLVAAVLLTRTLRNFEDLDLGMKADQLLVFDLTPQGNLNPATTAAFDQRIMEKLRVLPGIGGVSLVKTRPGSGWRNSGGILLDGTDPNEKLNQKVTIYSNQIGPDYFHTIGVPVLQGRDITDADVAGSLRVAVVNETFVQKLLGGSDPIGHVIGKAALATIVGVVKDSKYSGAADRPLATIYYPLLQNESQGQRSVEVRTSQEPLSLLPLVRRAVLGLDPNLPVQKPMTQEAQFEDSYIAHRLFARLAAGFGVLAAVLVATGVYGAMAYRVARRTNEVGVRMALGAQRRQVLHMVLGESLVVGGVGVCAGLPLAFMTARLLKSQLYKLSFTDPLCFAVAIALTAGVVLAAAFLPARHAASVDPMSALRME